MKMHFHWALLAIAMILATPARGKDSDKAPKVDAETQKLRNEFGLGRLKLLRQGIKSADIDKGVRDSLVGVCDQSEKDILAAVEEEKAQPTDDEQRKTVTDSLSTKFTDAANEATKNDRAITQHITESVSKLSTEMQLIKDGKLLEEMKDLDLTVEQESAIEKIASEAKKTAKKNGGTSLTRDEQLISPLLDARKQVRDKLNDEQKIQWDGMIKSKAAKGQKRLSSKIDGGANVR